MQDTDDRPPTDPTDGRAFTSVISGLHKVYPKEKMEEISTSFCFICLLHLANERGLKLQVDGEAEAEAEDAMDADDEDRKVGNLWDLKVGDSAALYQPASFANFAPPLQGVSRSGRDTRIIATAQSCFRATPRRRRSVYYT